MSATQLQLTSRQACISCNTQQAIA